MITQQEWWTIIPTICKFEAQEESGELCNEETQNIKVNYESSLSVVRSDSSHMALSI